MTREEFDKELEDLKDVYHRAGAAVLFQDLV